MFMFMVDEVCYVQLSSMVQSWDLKIENAIKYKPTPFVKITQHLLCLFIPEKQNYLTLHYASLSRYLSHAPKIKYSTYHMIFQV